MKIDLNCDLGEGFGAWRMGDDDALLRLVSSANVACGYHAGDAVIMDRTARMAREQGVDLGAHVSFPDLAGFGRRPMQMSHADLEKHILYQIGALEGIARAAGHRVTHLNPHGALGNLACADRDTAETVVRAALAFDRDLIMLVLSKTELEAAARRAGARTVNLFLADRAYDATGQLAPRKMAGAIIHDSAAVIQRVRRVLESGTVATRDGDILKIAAQSILVHGDTPDAVALSLAIRRTIEASGGAVARLSTI